MERRNLEDRPPDTLFSGATGLPPQTERELWRHACRILLGNASGCGLRLAGVPVYGVFGETYEEKEAV